MLLLLHNPHRHWKWSYWTHIAFFAQFLFNCFIKKIYRLTTICIRNPNVINKNCVVLSFHANRKVICIENSLLSFNKIILHCFYWPHFHFVRFVQYCFGDGFLFIACESQKSAEALFATNSKSTEKSTWFAMRWWGALSSSIFPENAHRTNSHYGFNGPAFTIPNHFHLPKCRVPHSRSEPNISNRCLHGSNLSLASKSNWIDISPMDTIKCSLCSTPKKQKQDNHSMYSKFSSLDVVMADDDDDEEEEDTLTSSIKSISPISMENTVIDLLNEPKIEHRLNRVTVKMYTTPAKHKRDWNTTYFQF